MDNHQYIFITGLHRSGTSILFQCLRANPHMSGFRDTGVPEDEGQHLQTVFLPASAYGGPGKFGFNRKSHLTEMSNLVSDYNRSQLFNEWKKYWDLSKPILLEKSPINLLQMRFLQELFPNSYFIVIIRHPLATSYATQKWSKTSICSLIKHWLVCHETFLQDRQYINRLLTLKYENFVAVPQQTMDKIYSFLGLSSEDIQSQIHSGINEKYFLKWQKDRKKFFSKSFLESLMIQLRFERRVSRFGYSLFDLNRVCRQ